MAWLRCCCRGTAGILLVFGSAALFNVMLLLLFPLRRQLGPLLVQQLSRAFLRMTGVQIVKGNESRTAIHDPHRPTIVLANHVAFLDIIVLSAALRTVFVSKQELRSWPLIGPLAWLSGVLFLDRTNMARRISLLKRLAADLKPGTVTAVFPQGTTAPRHENLAFAKGIFKVLEMNPDIRMVPVTLDYENEEAVAWANESFLPHLLRVLSLPRVRVHVTAHPMVSIDAYADQTVREVADTVERTVKAPLYVNPAGTDGVIMQKIDRYL